ncbi:hypothetical protein [Neotabrizicola sp. VNH66]|uniref:hypothetical protein n=1 Tax=Neotabrizicola sp. VNH66 TaxID=3400918 RepID=UPI003BFB5FF5
MGKRLTRLLWAVAWLLGLGVVLMLLASVLDHYDFHRLQWYVGEGGLISLIAGAVVGVAVIVIVLWQTRPGRDDG